MVVSLKEQVKVRYERHRHGYIQSVFVFCMTSFVVTMAVLMWFIIDGESSFSSKLCASYVFLAVNFATIIGKDTFTRTLYMLHCACNMKPLNHFVSSTLFLVLALNAMGSSVLCAAMAVLEIKIGAFGVVHMFLGYIPLAFISLIVWPNRLCDLIHRRRRVMQLKRHSCFNETQP
jgi:hypothetical protein